MSTPLLLSHNYSKVLPVCQLIVCRNTTLCMVIGKEYFSTICTALDVEHHHIAELPAVGDAQELAGGELRAFVARVHSRSGQSRGCEGGQCSQCFCGDHANSRSSTVSILAGHLHKVVPTRTVTYLIAILVMSPTTFMPVLLDVKLTRSPTRRPALTRLPNDARFHLTASIID